MCQKCNSVTFAQAENTGKKDLILIATFFVYSIVRFQFEIVHKNENVKNEEKLIYFINSTRGKRWIFGIANP